MTRLILILASLLALVGISAQPKGDLKKADKLFDKQLYAEALKEYLNVIQTDEGEIRWKAIFRAVESESLLFRYGDAAARLFEEPLPETPTWRARVLLLRAETSRLFLNQYGYAAPEEREQSASDLTRRTQAEWHSEIRRDFEGLLSLKQTAIGRSLKDETFFIDTEKTDLELVPTVWDFVVMRWTDYLLNQAKSETNVAPEPFLESRYPSSIDVNAPPAQLAGTLLEDASSLGGSKRDLAKENWKLQRVLVPFYFRNRVLPFEDSKKANLLAIERFQSLMQGFSQSRPKAQAGYEAAVRLNQAEKYEEAVALCRKIEKGWPKTPNASPAQRLRINIETPRLDLYARAIAPPAAQSVRLKTRNLQKVYFRVYRTSPEDSEKWASRYSQGDWSPLRSIPTQGLVEKLAETRVNSWTEAITYKKKHDFAETLPNLPTLQAGLYIVVASADDKFLPNRSLMVGTLLNVTDLMMVGTMGLQENPGVTPPKQPVTRAGFHLYTLNALNGSPEKDAKVDAYWRQGYKNHDRKTGTSNANGMLSFPVWLARDQRSTWLDALAIKGKNHALLASGLYFSHYFPPRLEIQVETDRAIYRPKQKLKAKATILERLSEGFQVHRGGAQIIFSARDGNGQEFFKKSVAVNDMASAAVELEIPTGRLLGYYSLNAVVKDKGESFSGYTSFQVEEYKRPEFEVVMKDVEDAWKYDQKAIVEGEAKYYFGGPVPKASVNYRIYRETYIPWICWFWSWRHIRSSKTEVASGSAITDDSGKFKFEFVPKMPSESQKEKDPLPSRFTVMVESRDTGGRTIEAQRSFTAGAKGYLFDIKPRAAFLKAGAEEEIGLKVLNLNERPQIAKGKYELYRLGDPIEKPKAPVEKNDEEELFEEDDVPPTPFPRGRMATLPLEALYADTPNGAQVLEGEFSTNTKDKSAKLRLQPLGVGAYRLIVKAEDPWGGNVEQSIVLLGVDPKSEKADLPLPSVSLVEQPSYVVGETATFLIGSREIQKIFVEYWKGTYLRKQVVLDGSIRRLSMPITSELRGGITLRWFGVKDFRLHFGEIHVGVPWKDKELAVSVDTEKAVKPGSSINWKLKAKDSTGKAIDGEATVKIYDRSLDYYAKAGSSWATSLYSSSSSPLHAQDPYLAMSGTGIYVEASILEKLFGIVSGGLPSVTLLPAPSLRSTQSQMSGYGYRRQGHMFGSTGRMAAPSATAPMADMAASESEGGAGMKLARAKKKSRDDSDKNSAKLESSQPAEKSAANAGDPAPRTNFAETAFFGPQIKMKNGSGDIQFTMPEQLTSWKVVASVLTKDVKSGATETEFVTRKDLMLRVEIPRFFREKDKGVIKAVVHNETDSGVSGTVSLQVSDGDKSALKDLHITAPQLSFQTKAHGISTLSWNIEAPAKLAFLKVRAIARAGQLVDAEERELPILPSRERLVSSEVVSLDGNQKKTLSLPKLEGGDLVESAVLQIDPQLILPILNSIPFLVRYPYECTEQLLNKYVPLSVVNEVFKKYPQIAEAMKKIPPRKTITPAWDRTDPRRLLTLMESPWESQSKGRTSPYELITLLKPETVAKEKASALQSLKQRQLSDGSFPWFSGGQGDFYITLYVLESFAEARAFGVAIPEDMVKRAYEYVIATIPRHLKEDTQDVSLSLYGSFVLSEYWLHFAWAKGSTDLVKKAVDYADKFSKAMTPIGKAYAALIYRRLGEQAKGELYLDRAMDGAREDELTGVYWAPEKLSWLWYNDSIDKHTLLIRVLNEMRPDDKRIAGMVKWLLFNRKGNEWKSTKASAGAVYSILTYMKSKGALQKPEKFQVQWGDLKDKVKFEPTDFFEKAPRWSKGSETSITRDKTATVEKEGPGMAFASLTTIFSTDRLGSASEGTLIQVERKFFHRVKQGDEYVLKPIEAQGTVNVGDQIVVQLIVKTKSQFEYVHLKVPKAAGFEAEELLSGWKWEKLSYYEEPRDSLTNFFISWLPHGEYVFNYRLRATTPGTYRVGPAVLQSMYAPEMNAYSAGMILSVKE